MSKDIASVIKGMDKAALQKSVSEAKRFLSTDEGRAAFEKIKRGEFPEGSIPPDLRDAARALQNDPASARALAKLFNL